MHIYKDTTRFCLISAGDVRDFLRVPSADRSGVGDDEEEEEDGDDDDDDDDGGGGGGAMFLRTMTSISLFWRLNFYVQLLLLLLLASVVPVAGDFLESRCRPSCERISNNENNNPFCDRNCKRKQKWYQDMKSNIFTKISSLLDGKTLIIPVTDCLTGCKLYHSARTVSCSQLCSNEQTGFEHSTEIIPLPVEQQYCVIGCTKGLKLYVQTVEQKLGRLRKPEIVRSSLSHSSVTLNWTGVIIPNITLLVHIKTNETQSEWQIWNHYKLSTEPFVQFNITNLRPYTTYVFKILAVITSQKAKFSPPSVSVQTLPHGVPSSPRITDIIATSPSAITVTWKPPVFPNGDLLGYKLFLHPVKHPLLQAVTREVPCSLRSWTFSQLQSSQSYRMSVSAWNPAGEGSADSRSITTPNPGNLKDDEMPYLVLGANNMVLKLNLENVFDLPDKLHESKNKSIRVEGIGVHIHNKQILFSDSEGKVNMMFSNSSGNVTTNIYPNISFPMAITIDWLNDIAYIIGKKQIYMCYLPPSSFCKPVIKELDSDPADIKVDPINGYLYFALSGPTKGIFRIDLADIENMQKANLKEVIGNENLLSFVIDFENIRLYFPNSTYNTMMETFLDGTDTSDIRRNAIRPHFYGIVSIVCHNQLFYWTDGNKILGEIYDKDIQKYHHNQLWLTEDYFRGFNMFYPSAQPIPVPHSSPEKLEVLFSDSEAHIRWKSPKMLQYQGSGAWNRWKYQLNVTRHGHQPLLLDVSGLNCSMKNLPPKTKFDIMVRAYMKAEHGPWSEVFTGETLHKVTVPPHVIVATKGSLSYLHLDGQSQKIIIPTSRHQNIKDLAWHQELIMGTYNNETLFIYNQTSKIMTNLQNIALVHCVAFDWLGEKIYWSNRKGNLIKRSNLYGNDSEIIYYAAALDMIIDSVKGILYWNTINSIEASYLNGDKHLIYYNFSAFTTKSIISLTLNFDEHKVYWVIHGVGIKEMYMADMIGYGNANVNKSVHLAATLDTMSRSSGLQYFSSRLFWLNTDNLLLVSDMKGNNTSVMTTFDSNITSFLVVHSSLQKYPAGLDKNTLKIIPELVPLNTIHTTGHYSLFNLTWKAVEVNYGDIFYELSLQPGERKKVVTNNWYTMNGTSPYLLLIVTIRPFTYWGCGPVTSHVVRTPMSVPSEPQSPRVYISQRKEQKSSIQFLAADLRWSAPEMLNGELSQYNVYYQNSDNPGKGWTMKRCKPFDRQFILKNLGVNQTYHFQIEACTPVGCGKKSSLVSAITNNLNPVPQLLIATDSAIRLSEVDSAINTSKIIADVASTALTFLAKDNNIFWFDKQNFLLVQNKSSQIKLTKLEGKIKDVTIDWISRIIYVANSSDSSSNIVRFSIDNKQLVTIVKNAGSIVSLAVNPYSSLLFWTVADGKGYNKIIRSQSDGKGASNLLAERSSRRNRSKRDIFRNCPSADFISPAIAVDYSENEIYFVDKRMLSIWKIDENGHKCLQNFASTGGNGLPPDSMTVDHLRLYWSNSSEGKLYSIDKLDGSNLLVSSMSGVQDIVAYGPHLQPLPDQQCLTPTAAGDISLVEISNTSVTLLLPKVKKPWCKNISQPLTKYTIYYTAMPENSLYSKCGPNALQCISKESYDREMVIDGLEPYTEYLFQVALSNAYTDFLTDVLGPPLIKWTRPGAPSPVHHLNTKVFTSESIEIKWTQPVHLNGPITDLIYVVNWTTETSIGHKIQKGSTLKSSNLTVTTVINELKAGHLYTFKVKMCQSNIMLCSNVSETKAKTYLEPGSFKLKEASSTALIISWTSPDEDSIMRHSFHYALVTESKLAWKLLLQFPLPHTKRNMVYNITLKGLQPDTWYCIRVTVVYESKKTYHWPRDSSFKFKTLSDVPNPPTPPKVREIKSGTYEISWPKPIQNGSPISQYQLQYYTVTNKRQNWTLIYSGTEPRWMVDEKLLPTAKTYYFQVRAANSIGWGEFSSNSSLFFLPKVNKNISHDNSTITLAVAICFIMVILILACFAAWAVFKRRQTNKRKAAQFVNAGHSPDVELAMLQDLPHIAVQQNNTLYSVSIVPTDADIAALPHFRHDQLMMIKFLGSGAFGEVFEGVAKNIIGDSSGDTRVAVKTLRKCASDQEKEEFLKEALLMSNFKHEHILRLLGVCLESNPQFIVLELMEGGDLLSFLRHCRPSPVTTTLLTVSDLMKICVHVARGCKYLEEMHFVHRDLAARNCLVSAKNPGDMIVKIGDFGLARDIYKNDYYRKEGEGLLPVRWMSPESLVDGVFTTQSDIWAFGVLMWEVVTLGQQPYPARTNIEVLQLVRTGGRLDRPENCPDYLYRLMTMCWSYTSDDRPSFIYLLQHLEQFYEHCPPDDMLSQSTITMDGLNTSGTEENEKMKMISQNGSEKQEDNEGSAQQKSLGDKQLSCRSRSLSNATDSSSVSGYMEPSKLETPKYLELICDSQDLPSPVQSTGGARPKTSTFNFQVSSPEKSDVKDSKQNDNSVNDSSNLQGSVVPRPKASGQRRNFQGLHYAQLASCSTNSSFDSDDGSEIYVTPQVSSSCTLLNRPRDPPIKGRELSKQSSVPITFKTDSSTDDRAWLKPTTNDDHNANRFCDSTQIYNSCASPTKLRIWADKNRNFINKDHNTVLLSDCPEYINASQPTSLNYPPTKISSPVFSNSHLTLV